MNVTVTYSHGVDHIEYTVPHPRAEIKHGALVKATCSFVDVLQGTQVALSQVHHLASKHRLQLTTNNENELLILHGCNP